MKQIFFLFLIMIGSSIFAAQETDFSMNGAVLQEKKDDVEVWKKSDGTLINVYKDRSEAVLPDKSRIIKYSGGRREVTSPSGEKIRIDDAKGEREYEGKSARKTVKFQGVTPFGDKITRIEKIIQKEPLVRMIYLPERSDELLYPEKSDEQFLWEIRDTFDRLYSNVRQKYINAAQGGAPYSGKPYEIQVSYCRYCKTGYCFGKEPSVTIEFIEDGAVKKAFSLGEIDLRDKEKMHLFVKTITGSVPE
jgi:hypothetical protein